MPKKKQKSSVPDSIKSPHVRRAVESINAGIGGGTRAVGGKVVKGAGKALMRGELKRHALQLRNVGSKRARFIGNRAAGRFSRAADNALRRRRRLR